MKVLFLAQVVGTLGLLTVACTSETSSTNQPGAQTGSGEVTPQLGGTVSGGDGTAVQVPAGSVAESKTLKIAKVTAASIAAALPAQAGQPFAFTPHGTNFEVPVTVTLRAADGANQVLRLDNEQDTTWEVVEGATFANGLATFKTTHFSVYVAVTSAKSVTGTGGTGGTTASSSLGGLGSLGGSGGLGSSSGAGGQSVATGGVSGSLAAGSGGKLAGGGGSSASLGGTHAGGQGGGAGGSLSPSVGGASGSGTGAVQFCSADLANSSSCYTVGMATCADSLASCCGDTMCKFALNCTLRSPTSESACVSDAIPGSSGRTLYNAAKQCLLLNNAQCPFAPM